MNFATEWWWPLLLLAIGFGGGVLLMMGDAVFLSKQYSQYLDTTTESKPLTRSLLFLLTYWPLTLFVLTSSSLFWGHGLVLGIGAVLGWEMLQHHHNLELFKTHFQIPTASRLTSSEIRYLAYAWVALLGVTTVLVLL